MTHPSQIFSKGWPNIYKQNNSKQKDDRNLVEESIKNVCAIIFTSTAYITRREAIAKRSIRPNLGQKETIL